MYVKSSFTIIGKPPTSTHRVGSQVSGYHVISKPAHNVKQRGQLFYDRDYRIARYYLSLDDTIPDLVIVSLLGDAPSIKVRER